MLTCACAKICSAPRRVQGQVARPELQRVTRRSQPRQVGLLGATRRHQLRPARYPRDHDAQHIVAGRRPEFVEVVQHEHERGLARAERRGEARRGASQRGHAETAHVGDQVGVARRDARVGGRQQGEQARGVVVEAVERHPGDTTILGQRPLRQQGRLAVTRGRGDPDHTAAARPGRLDEPGATHRTRARLRNRELGVEKQPIDLHRRPAFGHADRRSRSERTDQSPAGSTITHLPEPARHGGAGAGRRGFTRSAR